MDACDFDTASVKLNIVKSSSNMLIKIMIKFFALYLQ